MMMIMKRELTFILAPRAITQLSPYLLYSHLYYIQPLQYCVLCQTVVLYFCTLYRIFYSILL